jgi:hypothetical protein
MESLELKDRKIPANLIWPTAKPTSNLVIQFSAADVFTFENGGIWSDTLSNSQVPHAFYDSAEGCSGQPLLGEKGKTPGDTYRFFPMADGADFQSFKPHTHRWYRT